MTSNDDSSKNMLLRGCYVLYKYLNGLTLNNEYYTAVTVIKIIIPHNI